MKLGEAGAEHAPCQPAGRGTVAAMHHFTPQQLADRLGMTVTELLEEARRLGVPVLHGRIDRHLYEQARAQNDRRAA